MTIGNQTFCFVLYLTGVHFRGELQDGGDVSEWKIKGWPINRWCLTVRRIMWRIKCWPIRTREIAGVSLSDVLYGGRGVTRYFFSSKDKDPWLRLTTLSLKCYTFYFKGSYGSKTVCCCGTTLQKKRLKDATSIAEGITRSNVNYLCKWKSKYLHDL